jgi:hypothetical protein
MENWALVSQRPEISSTVRKRCHPDLAKDLGSPGTMPPASRCFLHQHGTALFRLAL